MKLQTLTIVCALALGLTACGEDSDETAATPPTASAPSEAAEATEEAEPAAEAGTFCCSLETHLREYRGVPYTLTGPDGSFTITEEMVRDECTSRGSELTPGACTSTGVAGTCTEDHMVWHYRDGADLEAESGTCTEARNGTWATP